MEASSDTYDVGVITAFCQVGQNGVLQMGFCDDEWMGPFRRYGTPY